MIKEWLHEKKIFDGLVNQGDEYQLNSHSGGEYSL